MTVDPARQAWDLILQSDTASPIGLMLYRAPGKAAQTQSRYAPSNADEESVIRDVGVTLDDFSGGFGHSQRWKYPDTYAWGEGVCTRWPRVVIPAGELVDRGSFATAGHVVASFNLGTNIYWVTDIGKVYRSTGGTAVPSLITTLPINVTGACIFLGNAYIGGVPGGQALYRMTSAEVFTAMAGVNHGYPAVMYSVTADNVGAYRMWAADSNYSVRYVSGDPSVIGNWGPSIPVGESSVDIKALVGTDRHMYVLKYDGLWDIDELGDASNLTPYYRELQDTTAVPVVLVYEGYIYISQGNRGLDRVNLGRLNERRDTPEWCQPGYGIPNETPITGPVTALGEDPGFIVAAISNPINGNAYIMYGQDRNYAGINGPGPILWHGAEAVIPPTGGGTIPSKVADIRIATPAGGLQPRLWLSVMHADTINFYTLDLPKASSPLSDVLWGGTHRFNTDCSLYTTGQDWGQEYSLARKQIRMYDVLAGGLAIGSRWIDVYSNDLGGSYTLEGTVTADGRTQIGPTTTQAYNLGMRIRLTSTSSSAAIFRGIRARAAVLAEQDEYRPYEVEFGYGTPLRYPDMADQRDAYSVRSALLALQDSAPFTITDEYGVTHSVRMGQSMEFLGQEQDRYGKWRIRARFLLRLLS